MHDDPQHPIYTPFMENVARYVLQTGAIPALEPGAPADLAAVQMLVGQPLPACYWWFLRTFGRSTTWAWFDGADASLAGISPAREVTAELAAAGPIPWLRAPYFMPFAQHGGYVVYGISLAAGDDPPVVVAVIGDNPPPAAPAPAAPSLSAWLREEVLAHVERQRWLAPYLADVTTHPRGWGDRKGELEGYWAELHAQRRQVIAEIHAADVAGGAITGPQAFQAAWMERFQTTTLYQRMTADQAYIPFGWTTPGS